MYVSAVDVRNLNVFCAQSQRFSTLISLMLSSQTKDEVTDAAVSKLRAAVGGNLTVDAVLNADEKDIADAIAKVGFWRRKTQSAHVSPLHALFISRRGLDISSRRRRSSRTGSTRMSQKRWTSYVHFLVSARRWRFCACK